MSPPRSEIAEDADVGKISPVAVRVEAEQEGPLEGNEAPNAGQIVAVGVFEACKGEEPHCDSRGPCPLSQPLSHKAGATLSNLPKRLNQPSGFAGSGMREGQGWPFTGVWHLLLLSLLPSATSNPLEPA